MDPLDRRQRMPSRPEMNHPGSEDVEMEDVGTFRGSGGNRDVASGPVTGSRKRLIELDSNEEVPLVRRRINEEGDAVHTGQRKLSQEEKSALGAGGKKGTLDGKKGQTLDEQALKKIYSRLKLGKDHPDLFPVYLKGYLARNTPALGHQRSGLEEAERLGKTNGFQAAREGRELKSDDDLAALYKKSRPRASDDEVRVYVSGYKSSYEGAQGSPVEQAERLGKTNGAHAAREGNVLKSAADLAAWYKDAYPGASDGEVSMYVSSYKASYEEAKGSPLDQAERLGKHNGYQAAKRGYAFKSDADLVEWYKNQHPEASDGEVSMYVSLYKASYEEAKGSPLEQAERLGNTNGAQAAKQGNALKSDVDLAASYKNTYSGVSDDEVRMYVDSYKAGYEAAKGTPLEQAERLGKSNGYHAARRGDALKSDADLATSYKETHPEASDDEVGAYVSAHKDSYERKSV